jgi:hypothetical protein
VPSDLWLDTAALSTQACIDVMRKAAGALRREQTSFYGLAGA